MWILVVWTHQSQSWILAQSLAARQLVQEEREERKGRPRRSEEEWRWVLQHALKNWIGRGRAPSQGQWAHRDSRFSAHTSGNYVFLKQWWLPMPSTHRLWQCPPEVSVRTWSHLYWHLLPKVPKVPKLSLNISVSFKEPFMLLTSISFSKPFLNLFVSLTCLCPELFLRPFLFTSLKLLKYQAWWRKLCSPSACPFRSFRLHTHFIWSLPLFRHSLKAYCVPGPVQSSVAMNGNILALQAMKPRQERAIEGYRNKPRMAWKLKTRPYSRHLGSWGGREKIPRGEDTWVLKTEKKVINPRELGTFWGRS